MAEAAGCKRAIQKEQPSWTGGADALGLKSCLLVPTPFELEPSQVG